MPRHYKIPITISLDSDVVEFFNHGNNRSGGMNYALKKVISILKKPEDINKDWVIYPDQTYILEHLSEFVAKNPTMPPVPVTNNPQRALAYYQAQNLTLPACDAGCYQCQYGTCSTNFTDKCDHWDTSQAGCYADQCNTCAHVICRLTHPAAASYIALTPGTASVVV